MNHNQFIAKTFFGLEAFLAEELKLLGAHDIEIVNRAVQFSGDTKLLYKVNLQSRFALSVLIPIHKFTASNDNDLYKGVQKFNWSTLFTGTQTMALSNTVHSEHFTHSQFAMLRVKDAIVDQLRETSSWRPNIDVEDPDIAIHIHISNNICVLSLNTSGALLFKRNYRKETGIAPLNEILAAAIIKYTGYSGNKPFLDGMTGSGTLCFEAAMIAGNMPASFHRKKFAFQKRKDFDKELWESVCEEAASAGKKITKSITGIDISQRAIDIAEYNQEEFELKKSINFHKSNFLAFVPQSEPGILVINPPYGERMNENDIDKLYEEIGTHLKHSFAGWEAWILSSNASAVKRIGLKPSRKIVLFNGNLECRLLKYELFSGKRNDHVRELKKFSK